MDHLLLCGHSNRTFLGTGRFCHLFGANITEPAPVAALEAASAAAPQDCPPWMSDDTSAWHGMAGVFRIGVDGEGERNYAVPHVSSVCEEAKALICCVDPRPAWCFQVPC